MPTYRAVDKSWTVQTVLEGAGVRLDRAFSNREAERMDPFLLLDYFHSDDPRDFMAGFPWHPHRGIETVTYMLSGRVEHGDSLGNKGVIGAGDVQWMTAGSGIIHEEMPKNDGGMHGFQLWVNLPRAKKMMDPRYQGIAAARIPMIDAGGGITVRLVAGTFKGVTGPVRDIVSGPLYLDVSMPANATLETPVPADHSVFAFLFDGEAMFDATGKHHKVMAVATFGAGDAVRISTTASSARFLLAAGTPLHEPIAWQGPIVMNTPAEVQTAFDEYRAGTFVRQSGQPKE
jgi:quercetin 2,3-dioxygenase